MTVFRAKGSHFKCDHNFFSNDTEESFYLAGFLAADGNIAHCKGRNPILKINLSSKDECHLDLIRNLLGATNPITRQQSTLKCTDKIYHQSALRITSKQLCNDLVKFNIVPRKTNIYSFPIWIKNHQHLNHFMRGYFDGDGSISKRNNYYYFNICGTKSFVTTYSDLIYTHCNVSLGMDSGASKQDFKIIRATSRKKLVAIFSFLYKNSSIFLDRKKQIVNDLFNNLNRKKVSDETRKKLSESSKGRSKLQYALKEIQQLREQKFSYKEIAKIYNCDRRAVSRLLS